MSKKSCCCNKRPDFSINSFCCNPLFFTDFITLYGDSMVDHAEVSPYDWIGLVVTRPAMNANSYLQFGRPGGGCNCCCNQCPPGPGDPGYEGVIASNTPEAQVAELYPVEDLDGPYVPQELKSVYGFNKRSANLDKSKQFKRAIKSQEGGRYGSGSRKINLNDTTGFLQGSEGFLEPPPGGNTFIINNAFTTGGWEVEEPIETPAGDIDSWDPENTSCTDTPCLFHVGAWCSGIEDPRFHAHRVCAANCCRANRFRSRVLGTKDIYFAYKYSGCHLIWFPREFSFGKDPYISQCNGFLTKRRKLCLITQPDGSQVVGECEGQEGCNSFETSQNSCSLFAHQRPYAGANFGAGHHWQCYSAYYEREYDIKYPCACAPVPHIHGGMVDSVFNRVNVRTSPGQLGYVAKMNPFSTPMLTMEEAGCCWCANAAAGVPFWDEMVRFRTACYRGTYPNFDGQGKIPRAGGREACSPGTNCFYWPGCDPSGLWVVAGNPNYKKSCYEWGISPYLLRVASTDFKMGYEIWKHGRNGDYKHDFGDSFVGVKAEKYNTLRDVSIAFRRSVDGETNLKEQYIGFIQLEHHFECFAYRSDDPSTVEISALSNMCIMLIPTFERGYGGRYTKNPNGSFRWTPNAFDNVLWQARRSIPRRVMYAGSGIPLFHFDLIAMESYCVKHPELLYNGNYFDPVEFLQHYYRYFYALLMFSGNTSCEEVGVPPEAPEHNFSKVLDSYQYVTFWLEKMIEAGILRIKDHAIDIAKDTNDVIAQGAYIPNPDTGEPEVIIDDDVGIECGGLSGYIDLINFFGVSAGTRSITPKMIKEKLLNTEGISDKLDLDSFKNKTASMRLFLPRRARLSTAIAKSGITGWGCSGVLEPGTTYDTIGLMCPNYVNDTEGALAIPDELNPQYTDFKDTSWEILNLQKIFSGLAGTFVLDKTGKIAFFGGAPQGGDECGTCFPFTTYTDSICCIPSYLSIGGLFECEDIDAGCTPKQVVPKARIYVPDGKVLDMAVTCPNLAVALVDFDRNGMGFACCQSDTNNQNDFPYENASYEAGEATPQYQNFNANGANTTVDSQNIGYTCLQNEPFFTLPGPAGTLIFGPRVRGLTEDPSGRLQTDGPRVPAYRLKSWGSLAVPLGTFSLSKQDSLDYGFGYYDTQAQRPILRGYIPGLNPNDTPNGPRYPAPNNWFVWQKIGSGLAHFVAIDDMGGAFATIASDNMSGQSPFKPLDYDDPYNNNYHGFESRFNYYKHIPRPGFIPEDLWTQDFYNSITDGCSYYRIRVCACSYNEIDLGYCGNPSGPGGAGGAGGGGGGGASDCFSEFVKIPYGTRTITRCNPDGSCPELPGSTYGNTGECLIPQPLVFDKTCLLMGSLVQNSCQGLLQGEYKDSQPAYIDLATGHFNTFLLTNENRLEGYGKYYQIDEDGQIIGPEVEIVTDGVTMVGIPGITCFVPEQVQALAGDWETLRGCTIYCNGITHSPIIEAIYRPPPDGDRIQIIKSSADYTICVTKNNIIYVWGDASMVPNAYNPDTYIPGTPASTLLIIPGTNNQVTKIKNVSVGVNAFYIHYTITIPGTDFLSNKVYSYTRYNREDYNINYPIHLQGKPIIDISAGFGFGMVLYGDGVEAKTWDWESFPEDHRKHQYKNFQNLPTFFKRDAFFHAIPGNWDYSKFLWGGNCCSTITDPDHPVLQEDICAAQAYNIYTNIGLLNLNTNAGFTFQEVITGVCSGCRASVYELLSPNQIKFLPISRASKSFQLNENIVGDLTGSTATILGILPPGNSLEFNRNLSRSGHPEYTWMRTDYRRLTFQGFSKIKDISDPLQGSECLPPGGVNSPGSEFGNVNIKYAACYSDQGDCWSPGRPAGYAMVQGVKTPLPSCYRAPATSCWPLQEVAIRGMTENSIYALTDAIGHKYSQPSGYRTGKDVFQKMDVYYAANMNWKGSGAEFCAGHNKSIVSYFKYCERHFYFGYDPETDVWDIYESPDILRNTITNRPNNYFPLYGVDLCTNNNDAFCERIDVYNRESGDTAATCGCGATVANVDFDLSWGGGSAGKGYTSLIDYPRVGPSFFREDYVFYPTYVVQDRTISYFLTANLCTSLYPDDLCGDCLPTGQLGNNTNYLMAYFAGPGSFTFRPVCVGTSIPFQYPGNPPLNKAIMWNRYKDFNFLRLTRTPSEILSGPYLFCSGNTYGVDCPAGLCGFTGYTGGVCGYIDPLIPPILGGSSITRTFIEVLKDPRATNIQYPWKNGLSNKWNPLCVESGSIFPHAGITLGDVTCFAGISDPRVGENNILLNSQLDGFSIDATCTLFDCCPPPEF